MNVRPPHPNPLTGRAAAPSYHVDLDQAHAVARAFSEGPRHTSDVVVRRAYEQLSEQADRWYRALTDDHVRPGVRVVHTRCPDPYATGEELAARVASEGVLELCPAAYQPVDHHPLLDTTPGGAYDRFRAVHDLFSHAHCGFGFDRDGEFSAWMLEDGLYVGLARWALATELHAEHSVLWTTGIRAEHKATLLPAGLLPRSRRRATVVQATAP
jgi:hypothetical protein